VRSARLRSSHYFCFRGLRSVIFQQSEGFCFEMTTEGDDDIIVAVIAEVNIVSCD